MEGELKVSSKILGHISEGLYRSPAGVFKELISNAFDANAKTVWISTGRPTFDVVSVKDDGDGMTLEKFTDIVTRGIGDSDKRIGNNKLINGRPVIGRLGIGILGIAQISHEFYLSSHSRETKTAFQAKISMKDFRKQILDQQDYKTEEDQSFAVGSYEVDEIPFEPRNAGMLITATEPTEGFRRQLSEDEPGPLPKDFRSFVEWSIVKDQMATGSLYNKMIWEVASLAPVPYMTGSGIIENDENMLGIAGTLNNFEFSVLVDGVRLFKPVLLQKPTAVVLPESASEGGGPFHFPLEYSTIIWGSSLKIQGYLYASNGSALHPDDIRGILIRLRHVGIREYDKSFMDYRYAEGPRFAWLTGELYVEDGLEDALTVGRDGFDAAHPHYLALKEWLHSELRHRIFPTLYRGIKSRRIDKQTKRDESQGRSFSNLIASFVGKPLSIYKLSNTGAEPVMIDLLGGVVTLNEAASWPRGKRQRETAQRLSIVFELCRLVESEQPPIENFLKLTKDLLSQ